MLRITKEEPRNGLTRLRLEGRVVGPWVEELARSCAQARGGDTRLQLEMASVSFLDDEAVRLVRRLTSQGASVLGCSPFVREQLEGGHDDVSATR